MHSKNAWIPIDFLCLYCFAGRGFLFGNSPKYKGDSAQFYLEKGFNVGLLGTYPYAPVMSWVES